MKTTLQERIKNGNLSGEATAYLAKRSGNQSSLLILEIEDAVVKGT